MGRGDYRTVSPVKAEVLIAGVASSGRAWPGPSRAADRNLDELPLARDRFGDPARWFREDLHI